MKAENQPYEGNRPGFVARAITPDRRRLNELEELNERLKDAEIKALKDLVDEIEEVQNKPRFLRRRGIR